MVWYKFLWLVFGAYLCAYKEGHFFLLGVLIIYYAIQYLWFHFDDYLSEIQAEELELNRKQRLAKFKVGTDAYYAERARQRADDAAEDARCIRNRNAEYEAELALQKARKAADEDEDDQLRVGQLF
jgi:hypothetical protein